jgi:hypothetical protein
MKSKVLAGISFVFLLFSGMSANADSTLHIWQCELNDGKTFADVAAASSSWLAAIRAAGAGEDAQLSLESAMAAPVSETTFNFVLSVADTKAWGELWVNVNGEELLAANAAFSAVASCDAGSIWISVDIK